MLTFSAFCSRLTVGAFDLIVDAIFGFSFNPANGIREPYAGIIQVWTTRRRVRTLMHLLRIVCALIAPLSRRFLSAAASGVGPVLRAGGVDRRSLRLGRVCG